jgi:hypothetical protein
MVKWLDKNGVTHYDEGDICPKLGGTPEASTK